LDPRLCFAKIWNEFLISQHYLVSMCATNTEVPLPSDDISQLLMRLDELSNLQKEFNDFKRHSAEMWGQEMKQCDSTFNRFQFQ